MVTCLCQAVSDADGVCQLRWRQILVLQTRSLEWHHRRRSRLSMVTFLLTYLFSDILYSVAGL